MEKLIKKLNKIKDELKKATNERVVDAIYWNIRSIAEDYEFKKSYLIRLKKMESRIDMSTYMTANIITLTSIVDELIEDAEDGTLTPVDPKIPEIAAPEIRNAKVNSKNQENSEEDEKKSTPKFSISDNPQCDYVIITALEEHEMEKVLPMITKTGTVPNDIHLIEFGHLKTNPEKKIAYASQQSTGMVDASILATELILRFNPKILIMAGVLGGKPDDVSIGDVVVATKVFTIDKGKISQYGFKKETEASNNENAYITKLRRKKKDIVGYIREVDETRESTVNMHFGPIACVRQVIDLKDFFEDRITPVDRKAIALEMESYGISRACELINNGRTKALIIKSAMDNTVDKVDHAKHYAAWTSAKCVRYILEQDLI